MHCFAFLRFLSPVSPWLGFGIAIGLGGLAWLLYRREVTGAVASRLAWVLPTLRSLAITLIALTLLEPALETVQREGEPGQIRFLIDGSASMQQEDSDVAALLKTSRWNRALDVLAGETGLIAQLKDRFDLSVEQVAAGQVILPLWSSRTGKALEPEELRQEKFSDKTALGEVLQGLRDDASETSGTVFVLLSDGQNNSGRSPISAVDAWSENLCLFSVGFGPVAGAVDVGIGAVLVPQRIYKDDRLVGRIKLLEHLPTCSSYRVRITHDGSLLWQQDLVSESDVSRDVPFDLDASEIVALKQQVQGSLEFASVPIKLDVEIESDQDQIAANNRASAFTSIVTQRSRVLLIDGRSRWETRYLKNLFQRDSAWELTAIVGAPTSSIEHDAMSFQLPPERAKWFDYDLIILGEVRSGDFPKSAQGHLREFVEKRGGGLVCIDGARKHLQDSNFSEIHSLLPVEWSAVEPYLDELADGWTPMLTAEGARLTALDLGAQNVAGSSPDRWSALPSLKTLVAVEAKPGSEVMAKATASGEEWPLLVTRRFGAGRVVYLASDETWRWRLGVADEIHTRLWNQLARWVMVQPFSVQNEYASLDTGLPTYDESEAVEIRCQLRNASGEAWSGRTVTAVVTNAEGRIHRVALTENETQPGTYGTIVQAFEAGEYRVQLEASGFPSEALSMQAQFTVQSKPSLEQSEVTCNAALLQELSQRGGGEYYHESDLKGLAEALRPLSGGRILSKTTMVWQSYWWFISAVLLLVVEWWLRKRAGLI